MFPNTAQPNQHTAAQQRIASIYDEVRYRICTNRYPPKTVLREEELAREYSVSRSPIRRVFSKLEHEGLVEIRHGIGTIVTSIEADQLAEVYAVRLVLAEAMGSFIEIPIADGARDFFVDCQNRFLALAPGDAIGFAETNIRYFLGLTDLTRNSTLKQIQRNLFFQTSRQWLLLLPSMPWKETIDAVRNEIEELLLRIDIGDPTGLGYTIRNNIYMGEQRLLSARSAAAPARSGEVSRASVSK